MEQGQPRHARVPGADGERRPDRAAVGEQVAVAEHDSRRAPRAPGGELDIGRLVRRDRARLREASSRPVDSLDRVDRRAGTDEGRQGLADPPVGDDDRGARHVEDAPELAAVALPAAQAGRRGKGRGNGAHQGGPGERPQERGAGVQQEEHALARRDSLVEEEGGVALRAAQQLAVGERGEFVLLPEEEEGDPIGQGPFAQADEIAQGLRNALRKVHERGPRNKPAQARTGALRVNNPRRSQKADLGVRAFYEGPTRVSPCSRQPRGDREGPPCDLAGLIVGRRRESVKRGTSGHLRRSPVPALGAGEGGEP